MLKRFGRARYLVALKWKQGEARAIGTARRPIKEDIIALFDMPPAGDFDHELGRVPEPTEHIKLFGPRLEKHCGSTPSFVDAVLVDDDRHSEGLARHPLTELLERGRLAGARPCPATSLDRSEAYQAAVLRFVRAHPEMPICLRLSPTQLERPTLASDVTTLLSKLECTANRVFLVLDLGGSGLTASDALPLAELIADRVNELPMLNEWLNIAVLMTAFPEKIALKAGQSHRYERVEWTIFQSLWNMGDRLIRRPIYGDYALEYPGRYVTGQAQPVAQFRYTTKAAYLVIKGLTTKKPNGYGVIRDVARQLVAEPEYQGANFSLGDAFVDQLARSLGGSGNASTWRWAWTDHHLTTVWRDLRALAGLPLDVAEEDQVLPIEQLSLI
jgi:hypothetical protein